jgi:hypothetical protein
MADKPPMACALCKGPVGFDQLFTFVKAGPVHFDCFRREAEGRKAPRALVDLLEAELKLLVAYKIAAKGADGELKALLETQGKDAERHAALLTKRLSG